MPKKLIEVALPLEAINRESAREKSIRHGHPSTLHLWWARRPLATARAVIFASLVDDPSAHPDRFPTDEAVAAERQRLFGIIEELVKWENSNNEKVLNAAKEEIRKATNGNPPALLDPFAGGGSIPLEAQRLGLKAYASDLNPVAVMINKAMIEIPPRFANSSPVNPDARKKLGADKQWQGTQGLAEDVRHYGEWMREEAFKRIGHLYPKVAVPPEQGGGEATVIAWIWARTVKCPNPACGCEMPLASSFVLSKKKGKEAWIEPRVVENRLSYTIRNGTCPENKKSCKMGRGASFKCPSCGQVTTDDYVKTEGQQHRLGTDLMAIVAEGQHGRSYTPPDTLHQQASVVDKPSVHPSGSMPDNPRWFSPPAFGLSDFADLFTPRQLTALTTFSDLVGEAQARAEADALAAGLPNDPAPLAKGGCGAKAYGQAVGVYLAFVVDKMVDYHSTICIWHTTGEKLANAMRRQAIQMTWDFCEGNPFCASTGSYANMLTWVVKSVANLPKGTVTFVSQCDAQSDNGLRDIMISTDPPYYDNIGYADLSDFFYVWQRQSLKDTYPDIFRTMLVPKAEELVATPYRFDGSAARARHFFESGMLAVCRQMYAYSHDDIPVTIYYAYKQQDSSPESEADIASSGWETMLSAIIAAGFAITGTWPMRTELTTALKGNVGALASSIVIVCRKRPADAAACTRREFIAALKRELPQAMEKLLQANIAPVDLAQSAIGPGMGIFSCFSRVLEADGSDMTVRSALHCINQELDACVGVDDLDTASRFCLDVYQQCAYNHMKFGDADQLARARNTAVETLKQHGVVYAEKGIVHLVERPNLPKPRQGDDAILWLFTQQLAYALEKDGVQGCAEIVARLGGANSERTKSLAYRLYTIADQKGWAAEALAYNALITSWQEIMDKVAQLQNVRMEWGKL